MKDEHASRARHQKKRKRKEEKKKGGQEGKGRVVGIKGRVGENTQKSMGEKTLFVEKKKIFIELVQTSEDVLHYTTKKNFLVFFYFFLRGERSNFQVFEKKTKHSLKGDLREKGKKMFSIENYYSVWTPKRMSSTIFVVFCFFVILLFACTKTLPYIF